MKTIKNLDDEMKEDPEFAEEKNPEKIEDKNLKLKMNSTG